MISELDNACQREADPPDRGPLRIIGTVRTGKRGRPRIEISQPFLVEASRHRGPLGISKSLNIVGARTVRRRQLEAGIATPQRPVFEQHRTETGEIVRQRNPPVVRDEHISNEELDRVISDVLQRFPNHGESLLYGQLHAMGHTTTRVRVRASFRRVRGVPNSFGDRRIHRRTYKVAGANALWHHDGQHGV